MKGIPRREFVFLSSGAAIGNMLVSGVEEVPAADDRQILDFTSSGLLTGKPKPLKYRAIPGFLSADQIVVLEHGQIVERGTHHELLAAGGRYRELYDTQYRFEQDRFINPGEDFTPELEKVAVPKSGTGSPTW